MKKKSNIKTKKNVGEKKSTQGLCPDKTSNLFVQLSNHLDFFSIKETFS